MSAVDRCIHCGAHVRTLNYAMGPMVVHVDPNASFPTTAKGTAWQHCKQKVATLPTPTQGET